MRLPESGPTSIKPITPRRLRILSIILGICLLSWLPLEDTSDRWVLIFSAALSVLAAAQTWWGLTGRYGPKRFWAALSGILAGILVAPAAVLLMALKTGLHGHLSPEFDGQQIQAVLLRTPIWVVGGLLVGLGIDIFCWAKRANRAGDKTGIIR